MEKGTKLISHKGVVTKISEERLFVEIESRSACSSCSAKGACGMSEMTVKEVELLRSSHPDLQIGDQVDVCISQQTGTFAIVLAYIVPIVLIVIQLLILNALHVDDGINALASLIVITIYYIVLYRLRDKIANKIKIDIKR